MTLPDVSTGDPHVSAHNAERDVINANAEALASKIDLPNNSKVGDQLRYDGTIWTSSVSRLFEGTVQPEGNVAAPIGSRYIDTSASEGAVEWLKRSGAATTNTGWILIAGDTGWRNVAAMVDKRGSAVVSSALLRRTENVVDLYLDLTTPNNTTSPWDALTLPVGFRPAFTRYGAVFGNNEKSVAQTAITGGGDVRFYSPIAGKSDQFTATFTTTNAWPSVLPGVAG